MSIFCLKSCTFDTYLSQVYVLGSPAINYISRPQTIFKGNKISLICNATNDEDAVDSLQILWYKTNDNVTITGQQHVFEKSTTNIITELQSTISFDPISHNDDGEYTCRAFNHPQLYTEAVTSVTVECKEKLCITITLCSLCLLNTASNL